jgi:hypothetical protein
MRYLTLTTAFLLLAMVSASGQMRGARGGGVAVSRGGAAPVRVASGFGASRFNAPRGPSFNRGAVRSNVVVRTGVGARRWSGVGFGFGFGHGARPYHHRRYYGYYPYAYGYPYYAYPYAYVGDYSVYDSGVYGSYYSNDDNNSYQQQQLNAEIGSLNEQIEDLREQNDSLRDYVTSGNPEPAAQPGPDRSIPQSLQRPMTSAAPPAPATLLVFRDGHRVEVGNYAIVGKTLWALSENRSQKYPLADIDLEKTQTENEKRGVEFTAPVE